jgi:hypothetical protein
MGDYLAGFACADCGVNTARIDEYYMVTHELWASATPDGADILCIGCLEKRLGRELVPDDFPSCWGINCADPKSERLLKRLGDSRKREAELKEADEASERFTETARRELGALWARCADNLRRESVTDFGDDDFSDEIFARMLQDLIWVARTHKADNIVGVVQTLFADELRSEQ